MGYLALKGLMRRSERHIQRGPRGIQWVRSSSNGGQRRRFTPAVVYRPAASRRDMVLLITVIRRMPMLSTSGDLATFLGAAERSPWELGDCIDLPRRVLLCLENLGLGMLIVWGVEIMAGGPRN